MPEMKEKNVKWVILKGNTMNNIIMCMWFLGNDDATREKVAVAATIGI